MGPWLPPDRILCYPSPELGISFSELLWGICSPPQKSVPSSPTFPAEGAADPSTGRGEGVGPWALSPQGAAWEQGHRLLPSGRLCLKAQPLTTTTHCFPSLALIWAPFSSLSLFSLALPPLLSGDCPGPPWLPGGRLDWAAGPGASVLLGWGKVTPLANFQGQCMNGWF